MHLRPVAKINDRPLGADDVDKLAAGDDEAAVELLERIREAAESVVAAGLHTQLSLREMSAFEIAAIAKALDDQRRFDRQALAAVIGMAFQAVLAGESPLVLLPDGDNEPASEEDLANRKGYAELMAAANRARRETG